MLRKQEMMLVAAAVAATVMLGGCDRPDSSQPQAGAPGQPQAAAPGYDSGIAKPVEKSADTGATVVAAARDDAAISAKVRKSIMADAALKTMPIQVETRDAVVTLSGTVDTPEMRVHAHEIAATTSGVARVVDNLTVKGAG